jgi:glutathione S-transferase
MNSSDVLTKPNHPDGATTIITSSTSNNNSNNNNSNNSCSIADYDRFELLCLKGSPYSERIRWVLQLLQVDDYGLVHHEVCMGELYLRYKVGRWNPWRCVTVPVAWVRYPKVVVVDSNNHTNNNTPSSKLLILENGLDIVEWANDVAYQRNRFMPSTSDDNNNNIQQHQHQQHDQVYCLIPPKHRSEILDYCSFADEIMEYLRGVFLEKCRRHPQLIKNFMEENKVPPDFILPWLVHLSYFFMQTKYRSTLQNMKQKRQDIEIKLQQVEQLLQEKQQQQQQESPERCCGCHLVGTTLTLADLYMAVAIDSNLNFKVEDDKNDAAIVPDDDDNWNVATNYPTLYKWAVEMSQKYQRDTL